MPLYLFNYKTSKQWSNPFVCDAIRCFFEAINIFTVFKTNYYLVSEKVIGISIFNSIMVVLLPFKKNGEGGRWGRRKKEKRHN